VRLLHCTAQNPALGSDFTFPLGGVPAGETGHEATAKQVSEGAQLGKMLNLAPRLISDGNFGGQSEANRETGEIRTDRDPAAVRVERYALQSVARWLLPQSRTAMCLRVRQVGRVAVEVLRSKAFGTTCYGGLQTCASVWVCPVCNAKISERRRGDLQRGMALWEAQGGVVWLLTLTHPHTAGDALAGLLAAETKALHAVFRNRDGQALKAALGMVGHVRGWEATHGRLRVRNNGWHPHFHVLLFLRQLPAFLPECYQADVLSVWQRACKRAGLAVPSAAHGVDLGDGAEAAAYVAKGGLEAPRENAQSAPVTKPHWGLDCEVTKGHSKRAKDGETPFDLLRAVFANREDHEAGRLFCEFAAAFRGKRQLVYSRGLRDLLGLDAELSDAELERQQKDDLEVLGRLTLDQWRAVVAADLRAEVLELARHGLEPVQRLLQSLGASL
jgi:hypothetical protein